MTSLRSLLLLAGAAALALPLGAAPRTIDFQFSAPTTDPRPTTLHLGTTTQPDGAEFTLNQQSFIRNGQPWFPVAGEVEFARVSPLALDETLAKMKAAGLDLVSTYVFWNHHEPQEGRLDWSGQRDLRRFLELCAKHHLLVCLRIGPWCHGEMRLGGLPDWVFHGHGKVRTNDPLFLAATRRWFGAIYDQVRGELWKQGGPVVMIQLENEFDFSHEPATSYMYALKALAREVGFDVPVYSQFSFPGGPAGQNEFLTMRGGYADAGWAEQTTRVLRPGRYEFGPLKYDELIGADLLGLRSGDKAELQPYPVAMAEMGSGMVAFYHRRIVLSPEDSIAMAQVVVGSGAAMTGHFMFAGGTNPPSEIPLQESRLTGYPNDLALLSYDFGAPIGEDGQTRPAYREYRMLHSFLNAFGSELAQTRPFFPGPDVLRAAGAGRTFGFSVRARGDAGFLFVNNHVRYFAAQPAGPLVFRLQDNGHALELGGDGITVPADAYFIWPFNLRLGGCTLHTATAQPLTRFAAGGEQVVVFFAVPGIPARFDFAAAGITAIDAATAAIRVTRQAGSYAVEAVQPGTDAVFAVHTASGTLRCLVLTREQAKQATRVQLAGKNRLLLTDADVVPGARLALQQEGRPDFAWQLFPAADEPGTELKPGASGWFSSHHASVASFEPSVQLQDQSSQLPAMRPVFANAPQPGPLYGLRYGIVGGAHEWLLTVNAAGAPASVRDCILELDYTGDTLALYHGGRLVADDFQIGAPVRRRLGDLLLRSPSGEWRAQVVPLTPARNIFFDDAAAARDGLHATLRRASIHPLYQLEIGPTAE